MQTCIQDVLRDSPTEAALQVQAFIKNLRTYNTPIDNSTQKTIELKIAELPSHLCGNILRTVFGIFVSMETDIQVRKNIALIAPSIWTNCLDEPKYKLGLTLEGYNTNLHRDKHELGGQFLQVVGGNQYRSPNERAVIVDDLLEQLLAKHNGWDNFHHEAPIADSVASYIAGQSDILPNYAEKLVKVVLMCRIGRGVSYCNGVSPRGKVYYDNLLSLLGDKYSPFAISVLTHYEVQRKLENGECRKQVQLALEKIKQNVVNARLAECFDYLINRIEKNGRCVFNSDFKKLSAQYVQW